ncbi:ATP-binding cassette domain-containing protein [bacterium]|nr:ATP-binding cassette domain-containing protein [bacterium]
MLPKNEIVLEARGLTKYYGDFLAVDNLNFSVRKGEIFGFLGPNGAGKTTTIRMLTALSPPSDGTAYVLGLDIRENPLEIKARIGVAPEISNLYDELSALDNLIFMCQLYGVPRKERVKRAEELLEIFNLKDKRNTLFRKLSKGMKRALTVASALVHRPSLVFLDEPTSGLDVLSARSLRMIMRRLRDMGVTIFLTTHYLEEADMLCDRIALIRSGKLVKIDTPEGLKASVSEGKSLEIRFRNGNEESLQELKKRMSPFKVTILNGERVRVYGDDIGEICERITKLSKELGMELADIFSFNPTLEDAFIELTGLSPIVMSIEKEGKVNVTG